MVSKVRVKVSHESLIEGHPVVARHVHVVKFHTKRSVEAWEHVQADHLKMDACQMYPHELHLGNLNLHLPNGVYLNLLPLS